MILNLIMTVIFPLFFTANGGEKTCGIENTTFVDGETLRYKIYYNLNFIWIGAGEVIFKVIEDENTFKLSAMGTTYASYDWFFKVRDRYETIVSKKDLLPISSVRDIQEGKFTLYDSLVFNRENNTVLSFRGKHRKTVKDSIFEVEDCIQDILSIIYYARNLNFSEDSAPSKIPASIFIDRSIWPLEISIGNYNKKHRIKGLGIFNTIELRPNVKGGFYFREDTDMKIWVNQDEKKIPLLIETPISVGSLKVILKETQ